MAVEIEVDPHHVAGNEPGNVPVADDVDQVEPGLEPQPVVTGWTPEQAGQFVCAIWNIGCVMYGPQWAADPRETAGWDFYCAQLLDQVLPRGMGGAVELGVGMVMVGNGLAMMTMRRWPIIKAGPRPIWVREQPAEQPASSTNEPPVVVVQDGGGDGTYKNPYTSGAVPEQRDEWGKL